MASNRLLLDGRYHAGFYSGRPLITTPFAGNRDNTTKVYTRQFRQRATSYTDPLLGVLRDPANPLAYLVSQGDLASAGAGAAVACERIFAMIPPDQVTYDKTDITKPDPRGQATGGAGTIVDNTFVSIATYVSYLGYAWGDNKIYGPFTAVTSANSGADTRVTWPAHGLTTQTIVLRNTLGTLFRWTAGQYAVIDPNTIDLLALNLGTGLEAGARYYRDYTPGTVKTGIRDTRKFYLAGVTAGIGTDADIPTPATKLNDPDFLAAVIANTSGFVDYNSTGLDRWPTPDSPLRSITITALDFGDI